MPVRAGKWTVTLRVALAVVLFSFLLMVESLLRIADTLVAWGWPLASILASITLVRMIFAGLAVLVVLPRVLRMKAGRWLPGYLRIDRKGVLLGLLSFAVFCALAAVFALGMGVFQGDLSAVFSRPDIRPDPDVVGWGFFILALVPGIWEELAFRGFVQTTIRTAFSARVTILLSATFFGLYHLSSVVTQAPAPVIGGVVMAFFFGIAWAVMTVRSGSVIPAMLAHYLVDSMGQVFLGVDGLNPALTSAFFLLLTLTFPIINIMLARAMYRNPAPAEGPGARGLSGKGGSPWLSHPSSPSSSPFR